MSTSLGCYSPTEGRSCQMLPARPGRAVVLRSVPAVWHRTPWPTAPLILAVPSEMSGKIIHPQRSWCHETHPFKGSELKAKNAPYRGLGAFDSKALCWVYIYLYETSVIESPQSLDIEMAKSNATIHTKITRLENNILLPSGYILGT